LAVVLYEMLTGSVPYAAETPLAVLLAHANKPLPLPRERNPELTEAVQEVLLKGLAKEPANRYRTAGEMARALEAADREQPPIASPLVSPTAGDSSQAPPTPTVEPIPRPRKRVVRAVVAAIVAIVTVVVFLMLRPPFHSSQIAPSLPSTVAKSLTVPVAVSSTSATQASPAAPENPVSSRPVSSASPGENLVANASFEEGLRQPTGWNFQSPVSGVGNVPDPQTAFMWDSTVAHTGSHSVAIGHPRNRSIWEFRRAPTGSAREWMLSVPAAAQQIHLSAWCKADRADLGTGSANLSLIRSDSSGSNCCNGFGPRFSARCGTDWTENVFVTALPDDLTYLTLWLGFDGPSEATVWYDDVSLSFSGGPSAAASGAIRSAPRSTAPASRASDSIATLPPHGSLLYELNTQAPASALFQGSGSGGSARNTAEGIEVTAAETATPSLSMGAHANFVAHWRARVTGTGRYELIFHWQGQQQSYHRVDIDSGGSVSIKLIAGGTSERTLATVPTLKDPLAEHDVAVSAVAAQIVLYLDGKQVAQATDGGATQGDTIFVLQPSRGNSVPFVVLLSALQLFSPPQQGPVAP